MYKRKRFLVTLLGFGLLLNLVLLAWNVYDAIPLFNQPDGEDIVIGRSINVVYYVIFSIVGLLILFPVVYIIRLLSLTSGSFPDKVISRAGLRWIRILFTIQLLSFLMDFVAGYQMAIGHHGNFRGDGAYSLIVKQWAGILYFTVAATNGYIAFLSIGLHKFVRIAGREKMVRSFDEP